MGDCEPGRQIRLFVRNLLILIYFYGEFKKKTPEINPSSYVLYAWKPVFDLKQKEKLLDIVSEKLE